MVTPKENSYKHIKEKVVVIYHAGCTDGFTGAWAAWKKFGKRAAYIPLYHTDTAPKAISGKEVYTIDVTFSEEAMKKLIATNKSVTSIDHHFSSEKTIKLTHNHSFSLKHSGASLAWLYFYPHKKIPAMVKFVEDIDLGKFDTPHAREALAFIGTFDRDFKAWNKLVSGFEIPKTKKEYLKYGKILLKYQDKMMDKALRGAESVMFEGHKAYVINTPRFTTGIGKKLALMHPPIGIRWSEGEGKVKFSLRSDGTVDVSKLAERFGGGGHKASAAFVLPAGTPLPWKYVKRK